MNKIPLIPYIYAYNKLEIGGLEHHQFSSVEKDTTLMKFEHGNAQEGQDQIVETHNM